MIKMFLKRKDTLLKNKIFINKTQIKNSETGLNFKLLASYNNISPLLKLRNIPKL